MTIEITCPVKACTRQKPGPNYIMCKRCWRFLPKEMRAEWRQRLKDLKKAQRDAAKNSGWTQETLGFIQAYRKLVDRLIQAAYREPITRGTK